MGVEEDAGREESDEGVGGKENRGLAKFKKTKREKKEENGLKYVIRSQIYL